jgi:menaquinone-9 beta-reductase
MKSVDVVVIGASLAGSACVRELSRAGIDAIAFERDQFPREKVCGGFLSPGAVEILGQLDVLDALRSAGAVDVRGANLRTGGAALEFSFRRPGMGVSRRTLDAILANHCSVQHGNVTSVDRTLRGDFRICLQDGTEVRTPVVIDAAGKLSRFGKLRLSPEFGVQFYEAESRSDVMDFWIFPDGYGGSVSVEGNRSNACFLIGKSALNRYISKAQKITGPVAYRSGASEFISIGDAAGMIDPFCGEGMHHALHTGQLAAAAVISGLKNSRSYFEIRQHYRAERTRHWETRRAIAQASRIALRYPGLVNAALRGNAAWLIDTFWG